jgi:polysaccharide biosynthesis protein PslH
MVIAPENPFPPDSGGRLRTNGLLRILVKSFLVDLITTARSDAEEAVLPNLRVFAIERTMTPRRSAVRSLYKLRNCSWFSHLDVDLTTQITSLLTKHEYDFVLIEHTALGIFIPIIRRLTRSAKIVVNAHNFETALCRQISLLQNGFARRAFFKLNSVLTERHESKVALCADRILVCSDDDACNFEALVPESDDKVYVIPNFIDVSSYPQRPLQSIRESKSIIFFGDMQYWPNVNGAKYFYKEIFPAIREVVPDIAWYIVGRNCDSSLREMTKDDPSVVITGYVESIVDYVARCGVVIVPLLEGSGTRLKILEAWAVGRPVVSTLIGCQGLTCTHGRDIVVATTSKEFVAGTLRLLKDSEYAQAIADNARATLLRYYDRAAVEAKLLTATSFSGSGSLKKPPLEPGRQ